MTNAKILLGLMLAAISAAAQAQTPQIGENVPAESFLGEQFCFETNFTNSGSPGFGPYIRLELPPGLNFDSAEIFGVGGGVTTVGVFPPAPGNQLNDPLINQSVTGAAGNTLIIVTFPVGSVVDGGPDLPLTTCLTIDPSAEVGTPLPIDMTPVYQFGDTATGDDGPIIGTDVEQDVIPSVLLFNKSSTAPESERPPGPRWVYTYNLSVDIANTATINPLTISDSLPPDFQYQTGSASVTGGNGCSIVDEPAGTSPGGTLSVECTGDTVGTAGGGDVEVSYSGYIVDSLNQAICETSPVVNDASVSATYIDQLGTSNDLSDVSDDSQVTAKHVAAQKGASPGQLGPGATIDYNYSVQVTDFGDVSGLMVTDVLDDGIDFDASSVSFTVDGGSSVSVTPSVTVANDTTVELDLLAAWQAAGNAQFDPGSEISLSYQGEVRQTYRETNEPVLASDSLSNSVTTAYDLVQGAAACSEDSSASVSVQPVTIDKSVVNAQPFYEPGDNVIFRLRMDIPSGDTGDIQFIDFLPLPVLKASDVNTNFSTDPNDCPGSAGICLTANDTLGLTQVAVSANSAANTIQIDWPDVDTTSDQVIEVDLYATVSDDPFVDGLSLTNVLQVSTANTPDEVAVDTSPVDFNVGAPDMAITKGVAATDGNGAIAPAPSSLPVDGDLTGADAGDQISYLITAENVGTAQAFDVTITDPGAAELTGCTVASVTDGDGDTLSFTGSLAAGIVLDAPLAANDGTPGAPFGTDTALVTVNCDVAGTVTPNSSFGNSASLTWASQSGATPFPALTDDAAVSISNVGLQKIFVDSSEPGTSDATNPPRVTIGEIVRYRLALRVPEGQIADLTLRDNLPNGLIFIDDGTAGAAFVSNGAGLSSSTLAIPNVSGNASSLAAIPSASLSSLPPGAISGGPFSSGTDPVFGFGDVTNADSDGDDEFLLVEFNALVANNGSSNIGNTRNNTFTAFSDATNLNGNSNNARVRVAEPVVSVAKSASPNTGDAGDVIGFSITVGNASGANNSPAYETTLVDTLPVGLANLRNVSISPNASCVGLATSDNTVGDTLDLLFSVLEPGCVVTVTFDADLTVAVGPGTTITNTATSTWTSLPGSNGTTVNPTGSNNTGTPGSTTGERDGSGGVNDYTATGAANVNVPGVGLTKSVIATDEIDTGNGEFRPTIDDLVVGESATFEIVATVPEGTTPQLLITDTVPFSNGVMRLDSASLISVGANLTPDNAAPPGLISDAQLGDGINDTVSFDFGQVINAADGVVDAADRVVIQVVATLVDEAANANGDELTNTALVQFGSGLNASASADIDVVEPLLNIDKSGSITQGDAGDAVTFTITIDHLAASAADAHDLVFQDALPADLVLNTGSINVTSGPAFDVNTSGSNTVALGWDRLDQLDTIVLEYQATLAAGVRPGQTVTNTGDLSWTSITGPDTDERSYNDSDAHAIDITEPGVDKLVFATSEASTGNAEFGPPPDLTIGEQVTYRFTIEFPEGTSENAVVIDQLPTSSSVLQVLSSQVLSVGGNLSGPGLPPVGAAGVASNSDADSINDRVTWTLGDVVNTADGVMNADDEIEFEVVAVVLDVASNQSGDDDQLNVATLQTATSTVSGNAAVDIVAPDVSLNKSIVTPADGFVDAGDTVTARLEIAHTGGSSADAFNLIVTDTLPPEVSWAGDGFVNTDCTGLNIDSSGEPVIQFDFATLDQASGGCFIEYQVSVDISAMPGQTLSNSAMLDYDSTPVFVDGQTRRQMDSDTAEVNVLAPSLVKVAVDTSQPDTGMAQGDPALLDLTIGETVTYELTLVFPEGTSTNVVLTDNLPASAGGVIEAIGASVTSVGGNISTTLPGTPVFQDNALGDGRADTVLLDFGTVTNTPDGIDDANDRIVVEIVGRVVDVADNADGAVLINNAELTFDGGSLADSADVEVVEPEVAIAKAMSMQANGVVRITLSLENTGTAPAYDLEVSDIFDDADWDLSGFTPITVPAGFTLNVQPDTPAADQQTLLFATDPGATAPDGTLPVASSISAVFDIPLAVLPPVPNPLPNTADLTGGDSLPGVDPEARDLPLDSASAQIAVPDLALDKTVAVQIDADTSGDASPGDTLRYTLTLRNTGAGPATNIVIDDAPDANSSLVNGSVTTSAGSVNVGNGVGDGVVQVSIPSLAATATVTITYDTTINNPLPNGVTELVNQALFDSTELPPAVSDDPTPPGVDDPTVVPLNAAPDLAISKDDGGVSSTPGGTVVYTLSYQNVGNQIATGVVISDTVPANTVFNPGASTAGWTCAPNNNPGSVCSVTVGDVAGAGAGGSVDFAVTVDDPLADSVTEISNAATIADDGNNGPDPTPGNNDDSDTTPVSAAPDLVISKDDGGATTVPGGIVVWTLDYQNVGNQDATGVVISDTVPANTVFNSAASTAGWTCLPNNTAGSSCTISLGTVTAGISDSISFAVSVNNPLAAGVTEITNAASIADDGNNGTDPTPGNNSDSDTTPLDNRRDLAIVKQLDNAPEPVMAGSVFDYRIVVTNTGTNTLTNVTVVDTLISPSQNTCATLAPGATCVLIGSYTLNQNDLNIGQVSNTATGDSNETPPVDDTVTTFIEQSPRLAIVKTGTFNDEDGDGFAQVGETISYAFEVTNTGNVVITDVTVSDPLLTVNGGPLASLAVGASDATTFTGTYTLTQADIDAGEVENQATATGQDPTGTAVSDVSDDDSPLEDDPTVTPLGPPSDSPMPVPSRSWWMILVMLMAIAVIGKHRLTFSGQFRR